MQLKPVNEQVVVLVGASSGIGRAAALKFANKGAKVLVAARDESGLKSLVEQIKREGGTATYIVADVAEFEQVKAIADKAVAEYGRVDTWVNLAAVSLYATFEDTEPEEFKQIIEVNLMGQVYGAKVALPLLKREGRGSLICISSIEAKRALPYQSAYTSSKHGVEGFVECLRLEIKKEKLPINIVNVMPASINTPFFAKARTKLGVKPAPMPPVYEPEVVADTILFGAEHFVRDLHAGGAGAGFLFMQGISPSLVDSFLLRVAFRGQKTTTPKPVEAPDNMFKPLNGYDTVRGEFGKIATPRSVVSWLDTHPLAKRSALIGTTLGAVGAVVARNRGNGK
jgi:NAD(P)-dependent dehydrogenase (short-subunit alcohol dehydrogenase family)